MSEATEFGARLKAARERCGISLEALAAETKISASHFEAMERGDLSRWPSGIFARAFVRAYAIAVGLDPAMTVAEFVSIGSTPGHRTRSASGPAARPAVTGRTKKPSGSAPTLTARTALRLSLAEDQAVREAGPGAAGASATAVWAAVGEGAALAAAVCAAWWAGGTAGPLLMGLATIVYYAGALVAWGRSPLQHLLADRGQSRDGPPMGAVAVGDGRRAGGSRIGAARRRPQEGRTRLSA